MDIMERKKDSFEIIIFALLLVSLLFGCKTSLLPKIQHHQYEHGKSISFKKDTLKIGLNNPLHCPLRIWFFSSDEQLQKKFNNIIPITLNPKSDTVLIFTNIQKKNKTYPI